jgi:DNA-binding XRE family transcriptional regulator
MQKQRLIYALCCPFTDNVHYIGKSTRGMTRPFIHLNNSHSEKIREWVHDLDLINNKPNIKVLEYLSDELDIDHRERFYIQKYLNEGALLLNSNLIKPITISYNINESSADIDILSIAKFIKERRKSNKLTQEEFADKTCIALSVIRKIEQGKMNINLDSLLKVLSVFGVTIDIKKK